MRYGVEGGSNGEGGAWKRNAMVLECIKSRDSHLMILHIKLATTALWLKV